jgi:hypothetical protein
MKCLTLLRRFYAACDVLEDHPHAAVWGGALLFALLFAGLILTGEQ